MCSARSELTARARIREAAIELFGRDGFGATSVRTIAGAAGVSPALVIHHFGNKDGLRRACDEYLLEELIDREERELGLDLLGTMQRWLSDPQAFEPEFSYLTRSLTDGTAAADELFDSLVARTEQMLVTGASAGQMTRFTDVRTTALIIAIQGLAPLLLARQVGRSLGQDGLNTVAMQRLAVPTLELYTHGLYADESLLEAAIAATTEES